MAKSAPVLLLCTPPPPSICRPSPFLLSTRFLRRKIHGRRTRIRAVREWQDYEEAVKKKDLARALRLLKLKDELQDSSIESTRPVDEEFRLFGVERDMQVLNTCLNADDMRLVGSAYAFLTDRGLLANFVLGGSREVTPSLMKSSTGLEGIRSSNVSTLVMKATVSKLSPKKWGVSGSSSFLLIAVLAGTSILIDRGIDIRPNLAAILALAMLDAILLGGICLAQISSYWPPQRRRILVHEAGHLLVAYLMGCPIRGIILDPIRAMQMGIQGQAGTQFWDEKLQNELAEGRLSGSAFDRYCMVLFAGIAAEALIYGEAEGGENDENLFRTICGLLEPPLNITQMSNQARWSVLQSYNLLKLHKNAHRAAFVALENGGELSVVIRRIEEAMSST